MPEQPTDRSQWNLRADGTVKGNGFLGILPRPDGLVSSELSVGTTDLTGKEMDIPTLVPTLTRDEVQYLLNTPPATRLPASIFRKAIDFARQRMKAGLPVFAQDGEQQFHVYPDIPRVDVPTSGFTDATIKPMASH
jgi:hypothetical protein